MRTTPLPGTARGFRAEPLSDASRRTAERGDHALIGISPGNSYFNQERLAALFHWVAGRFAAVDVVYVDTHIDTMLVADGRTPEYAARSARSRVKDTRRRTRRALEELGSERSRFRLHALSELQRLREYQEIRRRSETALATDPEFAAACEEMVHGIVANRPGAAGPVTPAHLRAGMDYLLAELPLLVDSPRIFQVPSSVVCYHLTMSLAAHFAQDAFAFRAAENQGFLVVRPVGADPDATVPGAREPVPAMEAAIG
ncbi:tRNA-dependent cyclodipeptide synthase [Streptomyces sp. URMC 123]|uniref:tRNA-dependent cyclodipeptide synthase n=1 Tax=Streptomyces sp. URMC 123 TaxID=3423403 RepID=UPI003F1B5A6D